MARVLIVDDEADLLLALGANLEMAGLDVVTAASGAEALALLGQQRVDIVLSDVRMPGMNGVELFREIRKVDAEVPVILMTAFALESLIEEAISRGAFAVLPKPFDADALIPMLLRAIGRAVVLVVEERAEALAGALSAAGIRAVAAPDEQAALAPIRAGTVDVCVVDLSAPGVSSSELVARIRSLDRTISCIAIAGETAEGLQRAAASGAFACLRKPVETVQLARTIARARARVVRC